MAGFIDRISGIAKNNTISDKIKLLTKIGVRYSDEIVHQSIALGPTEAQFMEQGDVTPEMQFALAMSDIGDKKYIAIYDKEYRNKRDFLRKFALNDEVEWAVDTICDESIILDDQNFFCRPVIDVNFLSDNEVATKIKTSLTVNFKRIYTYFNFQHGILALQLFKQWLIDGFLAFEIIYNTEETSIIGFKQLDPLSLEPRAEKGPDGKIMKIWVQYPEEQKLTRVLPDSKVIYISFAKGNFISRVSYIERLVRSHNLLRLMEHTRVIWNIMNSTFRMKMVVPVGTQSKQRSQESLNELLAKYKEDVYLDFDSGELLVNGKASMQFYKNYLFPKKDGDSPEIESVSNDGPELTDTDIIDFFFRKFKLASKIPSNRFLRDGTATVYLNADGLDLEERAFGRFINKLRSIYAEIMTKPLMLQMMLDHPELKDNELFISSIGIKYHSDANFEELKTMEIMQKRIDHVSALQGIMNDDGSEPMLTARWLIKKLGFSDDELAENEKIRKLEKQESDE